MMLQILNDNSAINIGSIKYLYLLKNGINKMFFNNGKRIVSLHGYEEILDFCTYDMNFGFFKIDITTELEDFIDELLKSDMNYQKLDDVLKMDLVIGKIKLEDKKANQDRHVEAKIGRYQHTFHVPINLTSTILAQLDITFICLIRDNKVQYINRKLVIDKDYKRKVAIKIQHGKTNVNIESNKLNIETNVIKRWPKQYGYKKKEYNIIFEKDNIYI